MPLYTHAIAYTDAGLTETALCFALIAPNQPPHIETRRIRRDYVTVNIAEYEAVLRCLSYAKTNHVTHLTIFSDSQLIVNQINGRYRTNCPHLRKRRNWVKLRADEFVRCEIKWLPREENLAGWILEGQSVDRVRAALEEVVHQILVEGDSE